MKPKLTLECATPLVAKGAGIGPYLLRGIRRKGFLPGDGLYWYLIWPLGEGIVVDSVAELRLSRTPTVSGPPGAQSRGPLDNLVLVRTDGDTAMRVWTGYIAHDQPDLALVWRDLGQEQADADLKAELERKATRRSNWRALGWRIGLGLSAVVIMLVLSAIVAGFMRIAGVLP